MTKDIEKNIDYRELTSMLARAVEVLFIDLDHAVLVVTPGCSVDGNSVMATRAYSLTCQEASDDMTVLESVLIKGADASPESFEDGWTGMLASRQLRGGSGDADGGALFAFIASAYKAFMEVMHEKVSVAPTATP